MFWKKMVKYYRIRAIKDQLWNYGIRELLSTLKYERCVI